MSARLTFPELINIFLLQCAANWGRDEASGRRCRAITDRLFTDAASARQLRRDLLRFAVTDMELTAQENREPLRTLLDFEEYIRACYPPRLRPSHRALLREYHRISRRPR